MQRMSSVTVNAPFAVTHGDVHMYCLRACGKELPGVSNKQDSRAGRCAVDDTREVPKLSQSQSKLEIDTSDAAIVDEADKFRNKNKKVVDITFFLPRNAVFCLFFQRVTPYFFSPLNVLIFLPS